MEILYTAIEEKQAELEESLLTIQHRKEHIQRSCKDVNEEGSHNITQNDNAYLRLEELDSKEMQVEIELTILSKLLESGDEFEDIRLAARSAHTCVLEESGFSSLSVEESGLNQHASESESKYQDLKIEYKRLKKSPPEGLTQEELLLLYMGCERKIAAERIRKDIFTIMAQQLTYEYNSCKSEDILNPEPNGLSI